MMPLTVGVLAMDHIAAGLVDGSRIVGPIRSFPPGGGSNDSLSALPPDQITRAIGQLVEDVSQGQTVDAVGVGFPGVIRSGVVEDSPNMPQMKGAPLGRALNDLLGAACRVLVLNDADAVAAGVAASRGELDTLTRVWTLGGGVGFGRYPQSAGVWEGGHVVVSLDPKEGLCGCGGQGHLEGIVGHRSMRLRFLDLEPEEVFANAATGEARCVAFVRLWHRAIAAATATSIHLDGPGRFFLSGPNARFVDATLLATSLHAMVKMSPLQGSAFEVIMASDDVAIVGAAVAARQRSAA